jgi:acyl-coenzyme A thioesterase PaaI-like protein
MKATLEEFADILARSGFLKPFGFKIQSCAPGECVLMVPQAVSLERPGAIMSGIAITGAADVAMWLAIMTHRGTTEQWVTTDLKSAFLRGARATDVYCTARVLKLGKRTAYGTAECRAANGDLLAHHVLTYAFVPD